MGCDIHAMIEYKEKKYGNWWINGGDPEIGRNYTIFSILANVRNYDNIPYISEPKGTPENCTDEFAAWRKAWDGDAHSTSYLTLKELKNYDTTQRYYDTHLITNMDNDGNITSCCRSTNGPNLGQVGEIEVFGIFGDKSWRTLIERLEKFSDGTDENIRIVFFFDN